MKTIKGERTAIFHNSFPFIIDLFFLCLHNHELIWQCFLSAIGSNVFNRPFYRILFFLLLPTVQLFLECICIFSSFCLSSFSFIFSLSDISSSFVSAFCSAFFSESSSFSAVLLIRRWKISFGFTYLQFF